jgi:outer membrane protein assembly factor BamB
VTLGPIFVAWAWSTRALPNRIRRITMLAAILFGCGVWTLARTDGIKGGAGAQLAWRWTPTPEERLLAQVHDEPAAPAAPSALPPAPAVKEEPAAVAPGTTVERSNGKADEPKPETPEAVGTPAAPPAAMTAAMTIKSQWPGFRGPARDGVIRGVRIETDWSSRPPVQLWRRPIGPGWSSFALMGDLIYTQEQRGDEEVVSCYRLKTGEPVWRHRDPARFYESNGGAGPRATPAAAGGRVFTLGATGILNALDAATGARLWSRNAATDTGKEIPGWGLAGSPLVLDDLVIVAVAGRLIAYDVKTGAQRWIGEPGGGGYSSPHPATIDGVTQVLLQRGARTISVSPGDGTPLWEHSWQPSASIVQPALTGGDGVLVTSADAMGGQGMRRLAVSRHSSQWTVAERWTSRGLKPYFNDFVVHEGHAFGFDGTILSCVNLEDGERRWKGGRYGAGQMVLLPDQDVLLILSEEGELALVAAAPDRHNELARFKAIEGKTWNHPVLVDDILLVRNGEEMAAFRLSLPDR